MKNLFMRAFQALLLAAPLCAQSSGSEVTKWQDGKDACVSITYDDSSINQFRVAIPLMNERGLPGTFFIITGDIDGQDTREFLDETRCSYFMKPFNLERLTAAVDMLTGSRSPDTIE